MGVSLTLGSHEALELRLFQTIYTYSAMKQPPTARVIQLKNPAASTHRAPHSLGNNEYLSLYCCILCLSPYIVLLLGDHIL